MDAALSVGQPISWSERLLIVRSLKLAQAALQARLVNLKMTEP